MTTLAALRALPIMPLGEGQKLIEAATRAGMTSDQVNDVIAAEIAQHGGPSYTYFKAALLGSISAVVFAAIAVGGVLTNHLGAGPAGMFLAMTAVALWLWRGGVVGQKNAAFAAAVLRAHAQPLSHDEISVLKDHPSLARDRDARQVLGDIQALRAA